MSRLTSLFSFGRKHSRITPARRTLLDQHQAGRRLRLEALEERQLLSVELVADINPGPGSSFPNHHIQMNDQLYFFANNGTRQGLFRSDGTAAVEFIASTGGGVNSIVAVNNTLYYTTFGAPRIYQLWQSDGTTAGTRSIAIVGMGNSIGNLTAAEDRIFYTVFLVLQQRYELRTYDGTTSTTVFSTPFSGLVPRSLAYAGGSVFFSAGQNVPLGRELYKTNGTEPATLVRDIYSGSGNSSDPMQMTGTPYGVFFTAVHPATGRELWFSDGTRDGTALLADIQPGTGSSTPTNLTIVEGWLAFAANDGRNGNEPWAYTWAPEGPYMLSDLNPGAANSDPRSFTNVYGWAYFTADVPGTGRELYYTDFVGGYLLQDIRTGPLSSNPGNLATLGEYVYFDADDGQSGIELWSSYYVPGTAMLVADLMQGSEHSYPGPFVLFQDYLYFSAEGTGIGTEQFRVGPRIVPNPGPDNGGEFVDELTPESLPAASDEEGPTRAPKLEAAVTSDNLLVPADGLVADLLALRGRRAQSGVDLLFAEADLGTLQLAGW